MLLKKCSAGIFTKAWGHNAWAQMADDSVNNKPEPLPLHKTKSSKKNKNIEYVDLMISKSEKKLSPKEKRLAESLYPLLDH